MPVTKYYPIAVSTTRGANEPSSEQSTVLPNGSTGPSGAYITGPNYFEMGLSKTVTATQVRPNWNTLGQVGTQSTFFMHGWYRLGVQTIPSGTWRFVTAALEANIASNAFYAASIYVWRPSTSSVVGYIYDETTQLGSEWPTTTAAARIASLSGNSISTFNGDTLIVEFWCTNTQDNTTSYNNRVFFDAASATADFSADGQTDLSSWVEAPDTLVAFDSNQPIGPGTTPNTININQTGLGSTFRISQEQIGSAVRGT